MKETIALGKELGKITNEITDVFVTKDYFGELRRQYEEHVGAFYDSEVVNEFARIHSFLKLIGSKKIQLDPCETPLSNIGEVEDDLKEIVANRAAYTPVMNILIGHASKGNEAGYLIQDLIDTLKRDSKGFTECAERYDRHMGNIFSVADVIKTIVAYGRLSGLVDYYNFNEGKDGDEESKA